MEVPGITCLHKQRSQDGSIKFLWQFADGKTVEVNLFHLSRSGLYLHFFANWL